ncbi:MAG: outer membrane protein assembly factor BamA [Bryobacteraceae bacterium]|nr:outer membrane protein assembly factor BamA [Bryobacteraceae bacterium]
MIRQAFAAMLLVCLSAGVCQSALPADYYGRRIVSVYLEPKNQPLSRDQLGVILGIRPGENLEEERLARAIQRLWATLRYEDISVDAAADGDGVSLTFRTTPALFTGRVTVEGVPEPPNAGQLVNATRLEFGERFEEDQLQPALQSIMSLLTANGYYEAKVEPQVERRPHTQEARVRFLVTPGRRAKFSKPVFEGTPVFSDKKLIDLTKWEKWKGLRGWKDMTAANTQRALDRIRGAYLKADYLMAKARIASFDYNPQTGAVTPRLVLEAGPKVQVSATGAKVGKSALRQLVPIYHERTVDRELLLEGQNRLTAYFEDKGYFDAKVTYTLNDSAGGGDQKIVYAISPGQRYRLRHIDISGNRYFDNETIRERLNIIPVSPIRYRKGRFSKELLEADRLGLESLYRANGFRDVEVRTEIEQNWKGNPRDLNARLTINEGPQWLVESLDLTGVDLRLLDEVKALFTSAPNEPYSEVNVALDRDSILNYYFNNGYPNATIDVQSIVDEKRQRVALKYTVTEGRRNFVRDVLVSGLQTTRPDLVTSRLTVHAGAPLSLSRAVETQRRLYDLGIFARVDVNVQNPRGLERNKYVLLQVEEAKKYSLNLGVGAEFGRIGGNSSDLSAPAGSRGFSPRGLIGLTRSNMFGIGHTAGVTFRASNIQQRALLSYIAPQFRGDENVNLTVSGLIDNSRDISTFSSLRFEGSLQWARLLARGVTWQVRSTARYVFIDETTLNIDPALIPVYSQPVKTTGFATSLLFDRRDDQLDPTRGVFTTLDFGYALPLAKSNTTYTRVIARNSTYYSVAKEVVFARSSSFGWLRNLDDEPVPLPERFYGGGSTTHRGFPENQAGPRDLVTGFPIGGEAFYFNSVELRFPFIGKSIRGVLFHDMGNVFSTVSALSLRFKQKDLEDFDYTVQAVGVGVRVKTPVGPIRLDLAFAPNTPRFYGFIGTREELINGGGTYGLQRISRFQFHFSFGQAF